MMKLALTIVVLVLTGLMVSSPLAQGSDLTVSVEGGRILGAATDVVGVTVYKAVPFAAPPVGPDRWRAPLPVVAWSGVRESTSWPNRCSARQRQSSRKLLLQ
jgi:para-nitrobenzyl esterase